MRPLELLVRQLMFIAALALNPATHPLQPERKFRMRLASAANAGAHFDIDNAANWRVRFQLEPCARKHKSKPAKSTKPALLWQPDIVMTAASALRLEAIVRAYKNRDALAEKLARKMALQPVVALAFGARPDAKLATKPVWHTVFEIIPHAAEAQQAWIMRRAREADSS